jgi:hypothetical protein
MPIKNTAVTITLLVWDFGNNCGKTGQEANITLRAVGDLTEFTPSVPAIDEIDATNRKGEYWVTLTAAENNYDVVSVGGILTVPVTDCEIIPTKWVNESADLVKIAGHSIIGTGTQVADAFETMFNVATPTLKADTTVQVGVQAALEANNLDHLAKIPTAAADMTTEVADNTILSRLISNGDTSSFIPGNDGIHALSIYLQANATFNTNKFLDNGFTIDSQLGIAGLGWRGTVHSITGTNQFRGIGLNNLGVGMFADTVAPWYVYVLRDAGGLSALPQGEIRKITAYNNTLGIFTTEAFSAPIAVSDDVVIMCPTLFTTPTIPAQVKGTDNIDFSATQKTSLNSATPASNADITSILADTNEVQLLITDSKIAAQVKGMDADVITASALKTDAVNEITAAIWAKVIDGTITFATMSKILLAFTTGKVIITVNSFAFYDQSNVLLFTLPITTAGRIPVIA